MVIARDCWMAGHRNGDHAPGAMAEWNVISVWNIKKRRKTMKIGILNTSILTTAGEYTLKDITLEDAKQIIAGQEIDSAVGHQSTSEILTTLLKRDVPVNRQFFQQQVGQKCIVFKLLGRPEEGKILSLEDIEATGYKFQLLERKA